MRGLICRSHHQPHIASSNVSQYVSTPAPRIKRSPGGRDDVPANWSTLSRKSLTFFPSKEKICEPSCVHNAGTISSARWSSTASEGNARREELFVSIWCSSHPRLRFSLSESPGCVRPSEVKIPCTAFGPDCVEYKTWPRNAISLRINQGVATSSGTPKATARRRQAARFLPPRRMANAAKKGNAAALKRTMDSTPAVHPMPHAERTSELSHCAIRLRRKIAVSSAAKHSVKTCAVVKISVGKKSPKSKLARPARSPKRQRAAAAQIATVKMPSKNCRPRSARI